jgi:DNA-binding transcriptional MerR regulator
MFKIRDFSKFTRVSVKMLRHYDELGLLKPMHIDRYTNYRYYSAEQLPRLNRIIALKDLGFTLEQIAKLLDDQLPLAELRGMLRLRRAEIEQQVERERARLMQIESRLRTIEQSGQYPRYEVVIREVPAQLIASIRQTVSKDEDLATLFDELEAFAAQHQARAVSSPLAIYHDDDYQEEQLDIEVAVPLTQRLSSVARNERITVRELPAVPTMACVVYTGGYEHSDEALHTLMVWSEANDYKIVGALREVYLRFNASGAEQHRLPKAFLTDKRELLVTEIQIPVERNKGRDNESHHRDAENTEK